MRTATDRPTVPPDTPPDAPPGATVQHGRAPYRPRSSGRRVFGTVLVALGLVWLADLAGVDLRWDAVLAGAVVVTGAAILLLRDSALAYALVPIGTVLAVVATIVALSPASTTLSAGDRVTRVDDVADLAATYQLGAGELTLDLRDLELPPGVTPVELQVGLGELHVRVPDDANLVVDGRVGGGELVVLDQRIDGLGVSRTVRVEGAPDAGTLEIDAQVGLGSVEVTR